MLIGAGGGARAALRHLLAQGVGAVALVARDPVRAAHFSEPRVELHPIVDCREAFEGAAAIVNGSPLGMAGAPPMPANLLDGIAAYARGAPLFDMV